MLEPIPFAGMVEIDQPVVCCNQNCNQGRDCPLRKKELTDEEIRTIQDMCHLKNVGYDNFIMRFARAILRKAQDR